MLKNVITRLSLAIFLMLTCVLWISMAEAKEAAVAKASPIEMLDRISGEMIGQLKARKLVIKQNPRAVYDLVRKVLLPHVDMATMSRIVLGRGIWQKATSAQQQEFQRQFTMMLLRTYASALAEYTDETVRFFPLRGGATASRVLVRSQIIRSSGPAINLSYRLLYRDGGWYVYDLSVEGVSLVESMRAQFSGEISRSGMSGLLTSMAKHNQEYQ